MKGIVRTMWIIIAAIVVVCGLGVGGYYYLSHRSPAPHPLTAAQLAALRVDLPENTTNLKDGLIQFTISLQAKNKSSKQQISDLLPAVEDAINESMRHFTKEQLHTAAGLAQLKTDIMQSVDKQLPGGKVSDVYFSTIVIQ